VRHDQVEEARAVIKKRGVFLLNLAQESVCDFSLLRLVYKHGQARMRVAVFLKLNQLVDHLFHLGSDRVYAL
jgi:hypothetical protein